MFRNLSYRSKLLVWVMPALIVGLLALSGGAYWYINNLIKEELTISMLETNGKTAESINTWFKMLMLEPETMASTTAAKAINDNFSIIDTQNINRYKILREQYPNIFQDIYAANRKGEYHAVQKIGEGYSLFVGNISTRDYFKSIMAGGPAQITSPLTSKTTGIPTIFIVAPITDEKNRPQGLIGAGISLEYVQKIAESLKACKTGYGIVVAKDGTAIYHPNKDFVMQKKITETEDPTLRELGKLMLSGNSGIYYYTFDGQRKVAFYQPIPIIGWSVATVVPEAELFAPATKMMRSLAIITLVILILVVTTILMAARRLTKPLLDLTSYAQEIANGNLNVKALKVNSLDEIGQLTASFNNMINQLLKRDIELHNAQDELESQVKIRTQELQNLNEELRRVSLSDGLTGIANRRYFDELLDKEWRRAKREKTPLALIMIDIDYFKAYNDTYGHLAGDDCLKMIANMLKTIPQRTSDRVARYGGEEFVIVLPNTDAQGAAVVGEKIRVAVEKLGIEHKASLISDNVTISVGIAVSVPAQEDTSLILIAAADQALYQAKNEGRNRMKIAE